MFSRALILRLSYRHGFPFITSALLAVVIAALPLIREALFHKGTSIWTFAILATLSTAFTMMCSGRYRTFFITMAVMPSFLFILGYTRSAMLYFPFKAYIEYFLYFVAVPILLVWIVPTLLNRKKKEAPNNPTELRRLSRYVGS
jgi:hypothetical protein